MNAVYSALKEIASVLKRLKLRYAVIGALEAIRQRAHADDA
jgi:hypothetical protein